MRVARSVAATMASAPRFERRVEGLFLQALAPAEDGRQRVVQFVRDLRDGLAEHCQLLGLKQLLVEIARAVLEAPLFRDVAEERLHPHGAALPVHFGPRRDLDDDDRGVDAQHPHRIARHRAFADQAIEEGGARLRVGEAAGCKRRDGRVRRVRRVAEQLFERGIGDDRGAVFGAVGTDRPHEHTFVNGVEQTPEGLFPPGVYRDGAAFFAGAAGFAAGVAGGCGVGVDDGKLPPYRFSIAVRIAVTDAPELNSSIASRPTSMQIAQPMPCASHSVTLPLAARDFTKQS